MAENQTKGNGQERGEKRLSPVKIALIIAGLLLALMVLKLVWIVTGKPTIKTDYLAEYNNVTKPENFDPNQNAAPDYEKAFEAYVQRHPKAIMKFQRTWPAEISEVEVLALEEWLSSNSKALYNLRNAAQKPYCWFQRHGTDGKIFNIELPELAQVRSIAQFLLVTQAKFAAYKDELKSSLNNVLEIHKIGVHYTGPITLIEQLVGIAVQVTAFETAFAILDNKNIDAKTMADFQSRLEQQLQQANPLNFSGGESMYAQDVAQRIFTDDGRGDGQLIPGKLFELMKDWRGQPIISYPKAVLICLTHPGRHQTLQLQSRLFERLDALAGQTPWELRQQGTDYAGEVRKITRKNYLLKKTTVSGSICQVYQRKETHKGALVATLAILRYKADKGRLPENLNQLVSTGYLKALPMDPYSDGPLIYKRLGDDFTLYSVGANFDDDGGVRSRWGWGDQVFWPVERQKLPDLTKQTRQIE